MIKRDKDRNRLWWMAAVAILLFVTAAVAPVAAFVDPYQNNKTYVSVANPIRFTYQNATGYYVNLSNTTGGMNALHITDDISNAFGGVYDAQADNGVFYISDTGGKGGQDDVILMVAIYNATPSVLENFAINIKASGYNWTPTSNGKVISSTTITHRNPSIEKSLSSIDYLEQPSGTDISQKWKFAPVADYPIYNGQNMGDTQNFKMFLVDTWVGTVNETVSGKSSLTDDGMTKIVYNITSPSPFDSATTKVAFNVYAYNNLTTQGQGINWLNKVCTNLEDCYDGTFSGWSVGSS